MLRTRLVLGLLCLLVILLALGLYAIDRCNHLGNQVEVILSENLETSRALQELKRCIDQSTAALLAEEAAELEAEPQGFSKAVLGFESCLRRLQPINLDKKGRELLETLTASYRTFQKNAPAFLATPLKQVDHRRSLARGLTQQASVLSEQSDALLEHVHQTMQMRNGETKIEIDSTIRLLILFMIIAVIVAVYASFRLTRGLLDPLSSLAASIQKVGQGDLNQSLIPTSNDEVGILAHHFNEMARQLKDFREADQGKLTRLNRTIQQTLASFPDPIFVLGLNHEVEFRNPPADTLALKLLFAGMNRLPDQIEKIVDNVISSGNDFLPLLAKDSIRFHFDQRDHYYLPRIVLLREENSTLFGVAVILENITQARLMDQVKTNLISTVSHELKTPITSMRVALHLLLEKEAEPLTATQEKLVRTAREDTERLICTLDDLLDLSRMEQGAPALNLEKTSPKILLETALQSVQEFTPDAASRIHLQAEEHVPQVNVDRQRMAYVFTNLLTNALKYSEPATPIQAHVSVDSDGQVEFRISNQGHGIDSVDLDRIFDKFYRVPGTNKSGSGLGLSIAREVILAHQGHVYARSILGEGAEFIVTLPSYTLHS
ncbi:MAG: ATP-binding protein [Blastochloris sp.]|nr:ATP-binding protein [Blastochloris sp.]